MPLRLPLTLIAALLVSVIWLESVDPPVAEAQATTAPPAVPEEWLFRSLEFLRYTDAGKAMTAQQAKVHQQFVTSATRTTMPGAGARVTPHVILLAGAAATVYADAIIFANVTECGNAFCPTAMFIMNGNFAPAGVGAGGGATMFAQSSDYSCGGFGAICTGRITYM